MPRTPPTATLVGKIKRAAKAAAKSGASVHNEALEAGARAAGYASWHELQQAAAVHAGTARPADDDLPIDPVLRDEFDNTRNESRSARELKQWWDRPFALTVPGGGFVVRCLDGGAWDRSTWYGDAPDLESAKALAKRKLGEWLKFRRRPTMMLGEGAKVSVVRMPQHPHEDFTVLKECASSEEASAFIQALVDAEEKAAQNQG